MAVKDRALGWHPSWTSDPRVEGVRYVEIVCVPIIALASIVNVAVCSDRGILRSAV